MWIKCKIEKKIEKLTMTEFLKLLCIILFSYFPVDSYISQYSKRVVCKTRLFSSKGDKSVSVKVTPTQVIPQGGSVVLRCEDLSKSYTGKPQFEKISLNLCKGQRVGLIGVNGAGKSTLLKCLAKIDSADSGIVETASNSNVVYVDQEPDWGSIAVFEALFFGSSPQAVATREYFTLLKPRDVANLDDNAFADATDKMETANAWEYQERGITIAEKLNIPSDYLYRDVNTLSGGERKRVGLAAALLKQPDVLLLDEVW